MMRPLGLIGLRGFVCGGKAWDVEWGWVGVERGDIKYKFEIKIILYTKCMEV